MIETTISRVVKYRIESDRNTAGKHPFDVVRVYAYDEDGKECCFRMISGSNDTIERSTT